MDIYLVGGAIRDQLLGQPVIDKDWLVIGATPEDMIALGYQPVGKDFPVFIHPDTGEEYALARTERKTGHGYQGFVFQSDPSVTIEEDLKRRDLTINAIAQSDSGDLIDPYHGQDDIHKKCLRHISPAFSEDPLRLLRVARFQAKLPDFTIAEDTLSLMTHIVDNGEVQYLVAERVWAETKKSLQYPDVGLYFSTLDSCGALAILFPHWSPWPADLSQLVNDTALDAVDRFAILCHTLNDTDLKHMIKQYRVSKEFADVARVVQRHHTQYAALNQNSAEDLLTFLHQTDASRRPERFLKALSICHTLYPKTSPQTLIDAQHILAQLSTESLQNKDLSPADFAKEWRALKLQTLSNWLAQTK